MHHTENDDAKEAAAALAAALDYRRRGWSIIPIRPGTKKPACPKWEPYQQRPADETQLRRWFADGKPLGLAVVFGEVSGGLVCRDFDMMDGYEKWAADHPDLADTLPTVATARGRHVYFRAAAANLRFVNLADGEYRGDAGHYCLLPPSRHPDGPPYRWLVALPAGELPLVGDVRAAGLLDAAPDATERTERYGEDGNTQAIGVVGGTPSTASSRCSLLHDNDRATETTTPQPPSPAIPAELERLLVEALPEAQGQRNRQVFELARTLKAIPYLADASPDQLEPVVRRWHVLGVARGVIRTVPFEETWIDFLKGWPKVRFPKGDEPMAGIFEQVRRSPLPAAASGYEGAGLRLLVGLCRELQRLAGQQPFFLACRTAGRLLGVDPATAMKPPFWRAHVLCAARADRSVKSHSDPESAGRRIENQGLTTTENCQGWCKAQT